MDKNLEAGVPLDEEPPKEGNIVKDDPFGIFEDGKIDAKDVKNFLKSRTIWVNIIAIIAFFVQKKFGFVIDETLQMQILGVINIGLRFITKEPVAWKK